MFRWSLLVCLILLLPIAWAHAPVETSRSEVGALKALFWATDGRRWTHTWDVQGYSDPCRDHWYGVQCDRDARIIRIRLANNHLVGYIPKEFARRKLSALRELDLSSNFLTKTVPTSLSILTSLQILRLDGNKFTGTIPSSLALLKRLKYLELHTNSFNKAEDAEDGSVIPTELQLMVRETNCHFLATANGNLAEVHIRRSYNDELLFNKVINDHRRTAHCDWSCTMG